MIPKIIHYCWFGDGEKPALVKEYIETWKKHCPDYEIIEWNESNFDVNALEFTKQAYEAKKWAFVSDVARLYALYEHGGIYMDTDVELLKPLEVFLDDYAFTGFESKDTPVVTAVMGTEKKNPLIKAIMNYYNDIKFLNDDGSYNMKANTRIFAEYFIKNGIKGNGKKQIIKNMTIYPQIYFCPNTLSMVFNSSSPRSYSIHHYGQSDDWSYSKVTNQPFKTRLRQYIVGKMRNIIGTERVRKLAKKLL